MSHAGFTADLLHGDSAWWSPFGHTCWQDSSSSSVLQLSHPAAPMHSADPKESTLKRFFLQLQQRILLINVCNKFVSCTPQASPKQFVHPKRSTDIDSDSHKVKAKQNRDFSSALHWWSFDMMEPMRCTGGVWRRRDFFHMPLHVWIGWELCLPSKEVFWKINYLVCCLQKKWCLSAFVTEDLLLSSFFHPLRDNASVHTWWIHLPTLVVCIVQLFKLPEMYGCQGHPECLFIATVL